MPRMTLPVALWTALVLVVAVSPVQSQTHDHAGHDGSAAASGPAVPAMLPAPAYGRPMVAGYAPMPTVPRTTLPVLPPTSQADWARRTAWHFHLNDLYERHSHYLGPTGPVPYPPQGYPYLNAGLYPTPQPNVPYQVGSTLITNQALAPHEFLYPHTYRAMYPPYYYKVDGGWVQTPLGVWSNEKWRLQGTMVKVRYRSHYAPFSMFVPTFSRGHVGDIGIWD